MKTRLLLIHVLMLLGSFIILAQDTKVHSRNHTFEIESQILGETRNLSVYLPADYSNSETVYPVLYLLDGGTHLQHASAAVDFLANLRLIPNTIVVAVYNIDRTRDFSPVHVDEQPTTGGADKFLGFLSEELVPYMESNYHSAGFNILLGHSFGGTFAVHALVAKPELFDAYLAVSPYLMYADNYVVKQATEKLKPATGFGFFFMTVGDEPGYLETLDEFSSLMKEKAGDKMEFKYVKMEEENHGTTPYLTLFNGMRFIFSEWNLSQEIFQAGLKAIDDHYKKLTEKFGFEVTTPELVINALGYYYLQGRNYDKAIATFKKNVKRYPESANVYDSLGEGYENNGESELAETNYEMAVKLGEKNGDPNLNIYKTNLERMRNQ